MVNLIIHSIRLVRHYRVQKYYVFSSFSVESSHLVPGPQHVSRISKNIRLSCLKMRNGFQFPITSDIVGCTPESTSWESLPFPSDSTGLELLRVYDAPTRIIIRNTFISEQWIYLSTAWFCRAWFRFWGLLLWARIACFFLVTFLEIDFVTLS